MGAGWESFCSGWGRVYSWLTRKKLFLSWWAEASCQRGETQQFVCRMGGIVNGFSYLLQVPWRCSAPIWGVGTQWFLGNGWSLQCHTGQWRKEELDSSWSQQPSLLSSWHWSPTWELSHPTGDKPSERVLLSANFRNLTDRWWRSSRRCTVLRGEGKECILKGNRRWWSKNQTWVYHKLFPVRQEFHGPTANCGWSQPHPAAELLLQQSWDNAGPGVGWCWLLGGMAQDAQMTSLPKRSGRQVCSLQVPWSLAWMGHTTCPSRMSS